MSNDYELGKLIGQIEALETKIESNTKLIGKMESCIMETRKERKEEIDVLKEEIRRTNTRLDSIVEQLSIYATTIKIVKTLFYGGILLLTFKLGDVRDLIGSIWK